MAVAIAMAPPDPPSPRMTATFGTPKRQACVGRPRDRFSLAALFGANAGIGTGRVHQRNHGNAETVGHFHQAYGLSISFRARHAEIVLEPAFGVGAFLVANDAHALAAESSEAADDRGIVPELAVARERNEIRDQPGNVIEAVRALRMTRHLSFLPGRKICIQFLQSLRGFHFKVADLFADRDGVSGLTHCAQFLDLGLQFGHWFFKVEITSHWDPRWVCFRAK